MRVTTLSVYNTRSISVIITEMEEKARKIRSDFFRYKDKSSAVMQLIELHETAITATPQTIDEHRLVEEGIAYLESILQIVTQDENSTF